MQIVFFFSINILCNGFFFQFQKLNYIQKGAKKTSEEFHGDREHRIRQPDLK